MILQKSQYLYLLLKKTFIIIIITLKTAEYNFSGFLTNIKSSEKQHLSEIEITL